MRNTLAETLPSPAEARFGVDLRTTDAIYRQALWGIRPAQEGSDGTADRAPAAQPAARPA